MLNANPEPAEIEITVYFEDRDPAGPYRSTVPPRRTLHGEQLGDLLDLFGGAASALARSPTSACSRCSAKPPTTPSSSPTASPARPRSSS
jgi:sensory rhodopsin transducer